jgi:ribosome-associated protein
MKKKKKPDTHFSSIVLDLRQLVLSSLEDGKAKDVVTIPLKGKSDIADYLVIASGTSDRHACALASNLVTSIKKSIPDTPVTIEGASEGNWVLVDAGRIIVHVFKPGVREIYNLEDMWAHPLFEDSHSTVY